MEIDNVSKFKKAKIFDAELCVICQCEEGPHNYKNYVRNPHSDSIKKLLECLKQRCEHGEPEYRKVIDFLSSASEGTSSEKLSYHKSCYKNVTNKVNIERCKVRFDHFVTSSQNNDQVLKKKIGRPPSSSSVAIAPINERIFRQRNFDKELCVLCQEETLYTLHEVATANMGKQLTTIAEECADASLKARLSILVACKDDPLTAVAYDMKYHLECLVKFNREVKKVEKTIGSADTSDNYKTLLSDMEIVDIVNCTLEDQRNIVINMNDIHTTYLNILEENEIAIPENPQFKPKLKKLIQENIPNIHFNRLPDRSKPEQIMSTKTKQRTIGEATRMQDAKDDLKILLKAAKILRREIVNSSAWKYDGTFQDYKVPEMVFTFFKHTIQCMRSVQSDRKQSDIDISILQLAQQCADVCKSDRQVLYKSKYDKSSFRGHSETPQSVSLALEVHTKYRSKSLIELLHDRHMSIPYGKVLEIENGLAAGISKQMQVTGGVYIPPWLKKDKFVWFAIDNIDFSEDTVNGKNTLHATAIAVYQNKEDDGSYVVQPLQHQRKYDDKTVVEYEHKILNCAVPKTLKKVLNCELANSFSMLEDCYETDLIWIIGSSNIEKNEINSKVEKPPGTWSAFNSLLCKLQEQTNVAVVPPLIRQPPTNYSVLYSSFMRAQLITEKTLGPNKLTVITLDLQLYDMAMKLWVSRQDIQKIFIFRPGELHVLFWALASLGKYIEGSGIDQIWIELGVYSPSTVTQILSGKHVYRAIEAHIVTLLALYDLYFERFLEIESNERVLLERLSLDLRNAYELSIHDGNPYARNLIIVVSSAKKKIKDSKLILKLHEYERNFNFKQQFTRNYMKQVETVLCYVRATRQNYWLLHLQSTEALIKYFFAHDHQNYARLLPLYLSSMQQLKETHGYVWSEFMQGHFCVNKSEIGFTSIAPDHGIEHENRKLKVSGGIVGITQNEHALNIFLLVAPEISRILEEYKADCGFQIPNSKRHQHHEITGPKCTRIIENATCFKKIFVAHGNPFVDTNSDLCNLVTGAVVQDKISKDIVNRDAIGQKAFEDFIQSRLIEGKGVWEHLKKLKLGTFKATNASTRIRLQEKVLKINEERQLLQRFIIIARSRSELNLAKCIGTFEFSIIPRSLFTSDGIVHLAQDKSSILHEIENLMVQSQAISFPPDDVISQNNIIIVDAMAVVNSISKTKDIHTCIDFANVFVDRLQNMVLHYDEMRLVFDRYVDSSLKMDTRRKRTGGRSTYYHVTDSAVIRNISLKDWIADIRTKRELVEYLALKTFEHSVSDDNRLKRFLVTYNCETKGNFDTPASLAVHGHEEADTLLLLHAVSIVDDSKITIFSIDTDVFLLLIHFFSQLPGDVTFFTGKGDNQREIDIGNCNESLGVRRSQALLGFHAFTGCDMSGKFYGLSKKGCFKVFLSSDEKILTALSTLGSENFLLSDVVEDLERFVCQLFKFKSYEKVCYLRWFLYAHHQREAERLPPTLGSLEPHIL